MKKILISLCLLVCGLININARRVSLIDATVDKKGENVIITYDLDETSNIEMFFSPTGKDDDYRQIWKSEVSGACGENVGKGSKKVTWKALKNYGCIITSEGRIKIIASKSELAENFKNSPMGQMVNSFKSSSNKSTSSSDKYEAISKPLTLCVLGKEQNQEPQYNLRITCSSFLNSKDNIVYIGYEYQSNYSTKGVVPKLDLSMIQPDGSVEVIYSGPAQRKFEIPKNLFQDGTTKLTATMHDPRKTITAEKVVRTRQNMLSFKELPKSDYELSQFVELKTITVKKKYKWLPLTMNFDKNTIIRGIRINVTHPSDNNLYFSSKPGIDLAGKNAESCKTEEQGYAYYSMVNTGIQSPDAKYTGLISYLPRHNYERPFANGYDEWTGIGLNMPITRQQKKDDNRYELYFIENEVYWAGAEKKDVAIEGIEVYVYEKDATEAELSKLVNAHLKEQEKIRKEREERAARENMPKLVGEYVPGYHDVDVPGQSSSQNISGTYYSNNISMSDMPTGKGYWVLVLNSNKSFIFKRCCDANSSLVTERYSGEYKYVYENGKGAGALWSNGKRIGTFITTSTGIRLGTIDMKKR